MEKQHETWTGSVHMRFNQAEGLLLMVLEMYLLIYLVIIVDKVWS